MAASETHPRKTGRIVLLDVVRGIAIIAMAIFHFTWDLDYFGFVERGLSLQPEWRYFARSIAASFLFLAGFSLMLAHNRTIRWRAFWHRFAYIVGAALLISAITFYAMPDAPIFFGILHAIAASSLIGLLVRRLPVFILLLAAILAFIAPYQLRSEFFNTPWLWWVGLSLPPPRSNDYVPLLPWLAPFLLGMCLAILSLRKNWLNSIADIWSTPPRLIAILAFMGRHSLLIYLLHQPLLFALVAGAAHYLNAPS